MNVSHDETLHHETIFLATKSAKIQVAFLNIFWGGRKRVAGREEEGKQRRGG